LVGVVVIVVDEIEEGCEYCVGVVGVFVGEVVG